MTIEGVENGAIGNFLTFNRDGDPIRRVAAVRPALRGFLNPDYAVAAVIR